MHVCSFCVSSVVLVELLMWVRRRVHRPKHTWITRTHARAHTHTHTHVTHTHTHTHTHTLDCCAEGATQGNQSRVWSSQGLFWSLWYSAHTHTHTNTHTYTNTHTHHIHTLVSHAYTRTWFFSRVYTHTNQMCVRDVSYITCYIPV